LYTVKNGRLRHYQNRVWDYIEYFDAFSIEAIAREHNTRANSLVVSASLLLLHPDFKDTSYKIEVVYRPSVPNNVNHWKVFNSDQ